MIPEGLQAQRDFSAGQIDSRLERRDDTDLFKAGSRDLLNAEVGPSGYSTRRAGTLLNYEVAAGRMARITPVPGVEFDILFRDDEFEAINVATGASQLKTGCIWNATQAAAMSHALVEKRLYAAAPGMRPQIIDYDADTGNWGTPANFEFRESLDGVQRMPFYRFGKRGVKIKVQGAVEIGSTVDITFDDDVLTASHVGLIFLYGKAQIQIATVTTPTTGTATVLQALSRFWSVASVASSYVTGFRVGDIVEGDTFGTKGQIVEVDPVGNDVVVFAFDVEGRFIDGETLVGPNGRIRINGSGTVVTGTAYWTTLWEEQFVSDYRGWPGAVAYDRERLLFYDFDQLPDAFLESAIGDPEDFYVGSEAADAIFEKNPSGDRIVHMIGGPSQFVLTTSGIFYIPISTSNPLAPGSIQMIRIGAGGASAVLPVNTTRGVIYIPADQRRIMSIRQTGEDTRAYVLDDVSRFHSSLVNVPSALSTSPVGQNGTLENLYVINGDGTMIAGAYSPDRDWIGFTPWTTDGTFLSVATGQSDTAVLVSRTTNAGTVTAIETLDADFRLDGAIELPALLYASTEVWVTSGDKAYGPLTLEADGSLPQSYLDAEPGLTGYAGFKYTYRHTPMTGNFEDGQAQGQRMQRRKINRYAVTVRDTQEFTIGGVAVRSGYRIGDNYDAAQPLRDSTFTGNRLGRSFDPQLVLEQDWPGKITVIEIGMEITS